MKHHLIQDDFDYLKKDIQDKEGRLSHLSGELGVAAKKSSSFVSNNPEYVVILDQINALQASIDAQKDFLEKTSVISFEKISERKIDVYSLVSTENLDTNEEYKYYIHYPIIFTKEIEGALVASPLGPVGSALIGHKVGDIVEVKLPSRTLKLKIADIKKQLLSGANKL